MHKIYHIPGVKIGCSTQPDRRVKVQGFSNYEIIEEHDDIYIASDREQELQKQYGYRVDECPYWKSYQYSVKRGTKEGRIKGGSIVGRMMVENGKLDLARLKSNEARKGTKHSDETKMKIKSKTIGNNNKPTVAISVFDKMDNLIGEFNSIVSASNVLNIDKGNICKVLKGQLLTTGGYKIKYK